MFNMDKQNRSYGGVANYVRDDLAASTELLSSFLEGDNRADDLVHEEAGPNYHNSVQSLQIF